MLLRAPFCLINWRFESLTFRPRSYQQQHTLVEENGLNTPSCNSCHSLGKRHLIWFIAACCKSQHNVTMELVSAFPTKSLFDATPQSPVCYTTPPGNQVSGKNACMETIKRKLASVNNVLKQCTQRDMWTTTGYNKVFFFTINIHCWNIRIRFVKV